MQEIKELNKLLSKYVDDGFFPGIQWQINIDNDQYSGKYGLNNIETQEKVLDNSLYRIWSMTKPIVAVAALQLIEELQQRLLVLSLTRFCKENYLKYFLLFQYYLNHIFHNIVHY